MPSGPKKRKAAKKKETIGDDDLELQESKECHNGGEVPSQDHHSDLIQLTEDEEEENGLGEKSEVGGFQSNENNAQALGKEEVRNIPVESQVNIEDAIIKENGRSGHEDVGRGIDEEDQSDGVIPVESQAMIEDTIVKENGRSEHEEIGGDIDEVDQCNDAYAVECQDKIEDLAIKENGRAEHEETGRFIDVEDQSNRVNGGIAEEHVSLVDPVKSGVGIVPTEDEIHEDEPRTEEGRFQHGISSSDGAEDQPCDIKNAQPEEDAVPVHSGNGEIGEVPIEKELKNENNSNEEFENEGINTRNCAEEHPSAVEGNQTPEVIYHVNSAKTAITSLSGQVLTSMDQESEDSVAENDPLIVSDETLNSSGKEEGTSHPDVLIEHVIEETGERITIVMDEKVDVFEMVKDLALLPDEMVLKHVDTTPATDSKDFVVDGPLVHSKNIPITSGGNEAEHHGPPDATPYELLEDCKKHPGRVAVGCLKSSQDLAEEELKLLYSCGMLARS